MKKEEKEVRQTIRFKEVRFCKACGGDRAGCSHCEYGLVENIVIVDRESYERPCTCGSGENWASCPENSPYCG